MSDEHGDLIQAWYERYGHGLYRSLCSAARNREDAEDISQEAFMKVAARLTAEEHKTIIKNPKAFLYRVAFNELYNRQKRRKLENHLRELFADSTFELHHDISPERDIEGQVELALVTEAIDALPSKQKQAFLMSRVEHKGHGTIATSLGIKQDSVKRHIVRALATLRGIRGGGHSKKTPGRRGDCDE